MVRLLKLIAFFVSVNVSAQNVDTVRLSGTNNRTSAGPFILQHYCTESTAYLSDLPLLYQSNPGIRYTLDPNFVAVYRQAPSAYYVSQLYHSPNRPPVVTYQNANNPITPNAYNPYGVTSVPQAIVWGGINYLLSKPRK